MTYHHQGHHLCFCSSSLLDLHSGDLKQLRVVYGTFIADRLTEVANQQGGREADNPRPCVDGEGVAGVEEPGNPQQVALQTLLLHQGASILHPLCNHWCQKILNKIQNCSKEVSRPHKGTKQ